MSSGWAWHVRPLQGWRPPQAAPLLPPAAHRNPGAASPLLAPGTISSRGGRCSSFCCTRVTMPSLWLGPAACWPSLAGSLPATAAAVAVAVTAATPAVERSYSTCFLCAARHAPPCTAASTTGCHGGGHGMGAMAVGRSGMANTNERWGAAATMAASGVSLDSCLLAGASLCRGARALLLHRQMQLVAAGGDTAAASHGVRPGGGGRVVAVVPRLVPPHKQNV